MFKKNLILTNQKHYNIIECIIYNILYVVYKYIVLHVIKYVNCIYIYISIK